MSRSGAAGRISAVNRAVLVGAAVALFVPLLGSFPSFAQDLQWTAPRGEALVRAIRAAGDHGLNPDWYRVAEVEKAVTSGDDKILTEAYISYAGDVSTGRVNANRVDKEIDIRQRWTSRADLLKAAAEAPDFAVYLDSLPPRGDYPALKKVLADLRKQRATEAYTPVPSGGWLKPKMTDARVPVLRTRLAELGYAVPQPATDAPAELYDEPLVAVVKAYQETKGLTVDGVIGENTTRSLNTSIDDRIEQVIANLERRRWLPEDLGSRYVFVNTGDYSMLFVDGGQKVFESLVIVGTAKNPTPEIQTTMRGFQTNPHWTVPQSISGEEYLPMLRRDPYALQKSGFRIFESWSSNDSELDPGSVDWSSINPKAFPYRIRQEPGAGNALGYIFFPFQNNYGIYMHDTATRWLFTEGSRNFSHGCIRLQNPLDFVQKVFAVRPAGFDKARVQQVIASGQQAHYTFPEPVTLYVTYRTVTAANDGTPTFRDDVYGRDKRVVAAMAKPRS